MSWAEARRCPEYEKLGSFRLFDQGLLADNDDDAGICDVEAAAVGFSVVADFGALRETNVAVDDGASNA